MTLSAHQVSSSSPTLTKGFSFKSAFALAFAYVSPIVGTYSVLVVTIQRAGPGAWWTFLITLLGTFALAVCFSHLGSRWPFEGSVYQWSSRLGGPAYGWWTGWFVFMSFVLATASIDYGIVTFLAPALGLPAFGRWSSLGITFALLAFATLLNITARRWLKVLVVASIVCEVIGSVGVGTLLLFFHRHQSFSILIGGGPSNVSIGAFGVTGMLGALAFVGWALNGFVSSADVAEEVPHADRAIPKALMLCVLVIGLIALYLSLAIIVALPNIGDVVSGRLSDAVVDTIELSLGKGLGTWLFIVLMISFFAGLVAASTAMSRVLWAYARDQVAPGHRVLVKLKGRERLPVYSVLASSCIVGAFLFTGLGANVFSTLIEFTTAGYFIVYGMLVVGFLYRKYRRDWRDGSFTLGRLGVIVSIIGLVWCVGEFINVIWPRSQGNAYLTWGTMGMTAVLAIVGAALFLSLRQRIDLLKGKLSVEAGAEEVAEHAGGSAEWPNITDQS